MPQDQQLSKGKIKAFQMRMRDHGWGYAVAWYIPLTALYYSITRRTITPLLITFAGNLSLGVMLGTVVAFTNPDIKEEKLEEYATFIALLSTPLLAKVGINQARQRGMDQLLAHDLPLEFTEEAKPADSSRK